ncbi:MAG: hypothetical protein EOP06_01980 [Proteobacteria bacterium]|nr:MAG: hypothetical protein EOP06_01980 [Pseudomonadota bacterium]
MIYGNKTLLAFIFVAISSAFTSADLFAAKLLIVRPKGADMDAVSTVVKGDLSSHEIQEVFFEKGDSEEKLNDAIKSFKPNALSIFDNKALSAALKVSGKGPGFPQTSVTMALNVKKKVSGDKNMCGIAFEVPALTIVTKFRQATGGNIKNVLTFYRSGEFNELIVEAKNQLHKEGINLIAIDLEKEASSAESLNKIVKEKLSEKYEGTAIDAIIIPTDNIILNKDAFASIWIEKAKSLKVPFLCNVEKFTSKEFNFCSYAAYPDYEELGHQYSEQLTELLSGTQSSDLSVDYIVSAKQTANYDKLKELGIKILDEKKTDVKAAQ